MTKIDPHSDLQDGFEPAPAPVPGPDGPYVSDAARAFRRQPPPHPSLCPVGPCKHYHSFTTQVDAENPRAIRLPVVLPEGTPGATPVPGGTVYAAPAVFHVQRHHYCYPAVGVEMHLGDLPITECNRYDPPAFGSDIDQQQHEYKAAVERWRSDRQAEQDEAAEIDRLIAASYDTQQMARCQECGKELPAPQLDDNSRCASCAELNRTTARKDPT